MRKLAVVLLTILLISCAPTEFEINSKRAQKEVTSSASSTQEVFNLTFIINQKDTYQVEVKDCYNLTWSGTLVNNEDEYSLSGLVLPYLANSEMTYNYKVINENGKFKEGSFTLPVSSPCLWTIENNILLPLKENILTNISYIKGVDDKVALQADSKITLPEDFSQVEVSYEYLGVKYTYKLSN